MKLWTLSSIFKQAVLSLGLLIGAAEATTEMKASYCCHNLPSAPLTPGEVALVRSFFGDAVNTSCVKKYYAPESLWAEAIAYSKERIGFRCDPQDFSRDSLGYWRGVFMHEMLHIWQFQTKGAAGMLVDAVADGEFFRAQEDRYDYELDAKRPFSSYANEQQAAIMEDYMDRFLDPHHRERTRQRLMDEGFLDENGLVENMNGELVTVDEYIKSEEADGPTPQDDFLLKKVVEDQFPQARITRLNLEKQVRLKTAAVKQKSATL